MKISSSLDDTYKEFDNYIDIFLKEDPKLTVISSKPGNKSWKHFDNLTNILTLKIDFEINIPFSANTDIGIILEQRHIWDAKFYGLELLEIIQQGEVIFYHCAKMPALISDRDFVVHRKILQDYRGFGLLIGLNSVIRSEKPPVSGKVRAEMLDSFMGINPVDGGQKTKIVGLVKTKFGGSLPNWAIKIISGMIPNEM